jgi:diadenylate cyclase
MIDPKHACLSPSTMSLASPDYPHVLQSVVSLAVELAQNGHEGKPVGTIFVIGDEREVLRHSDVLILDPMAGHAPVARNVMLPSVRGTLLKLAVLDGAFLVSSAGIVLSAARCLDITTNGVDIPLGLGSRHLAAASITRLTKAIAVVVSEGSPVVRLFHHGRLVDQIDVTQIDVTQTDASPTGTNTHRSLSSATPAAHGSNSESLLRSALPKPGPTRKAGDSELTAQLPPAIRSTAHLPAVRT